jgi:enoyl-CoA hydratase/carnithine racemase
MADAIIAALDEAQADEACRAVLLTGAGRGFCAGQDLTEIVGADPDDIADGCSTLPSADPENPRIADAGRLRGQRRRGRRRVQSGARLRHRARGALGEFVQAFARIGLVPDCGGTWFLPRLVGTARARALMMLAEPLPAETAAEWGMIWRMVEDDRLMPEAQALAARLASQADRRARADQAGARRERRQRRSPTSSISKANCRSRPPRPRTMPKACAPFSTSARRSSPAAAIEREASREKLNGVHGRMPARRFLRGSLGQSRNLR